MAPQLIIEFVPKEDEKVKQLLSGRADIFSTYDAASFEAHFSRYYTIQAKELIPEPTEFYIAWLENDHMIKIIQKYPLYLFLLPLFFVLHGFTENFGFIDVKEAGLLLLSYLFLTLSISGFSYFFFRNWNRASLITTFWISFFFFLAPCTSS
jgi:hypothetical protein